MNKTDSDFLQQLFVENNELRLQVNALIRENYNKTAQIEVLEDEKRQEKLGDFGNGDKSNGKLYLTGQKNQDENSTLKKLHSNDNMYASSAVKELEEAATALEKCNSEIKSLREKLDATQIQLAQKKVSHDNLEKDLIAAQEDITLLKDREAKYLQKEEERNPPKDKMLETQEKFLKEIDQLRKQNVVAEGSLELIKNQLISVANDSNRKQNNQQTQMQEVESLVDGIRSEYEEFIQITKLENEAFKSTQQAEYEALRVESERNKLDAFEEKKRLLLEYQGILFSMQTQFDEFRSTAEYLFDIEIAKLEDELTTQASRYQQEIVYVIQAKDKFYADMMIAKDAKIMSLIEGSDMQSLIQKHELDMDTLRKEHSREVERIKTDQDSERKNLITLLQRQNVSLETKCEKLQHHCRSVEVKIKELMITIEQKNKSIAEKEEFKYKSELEFNKKIEDANKKISSLNQEKEHLRHKLIRVNMHAKGEGGDNSIENMIKRLSRDASGLQKEFDLLGNNYNESLAEQKEMTKKLKEKEKLIAFLEKEIQRRNQEYQAMTRTFENFISSRAKFSRQEQAKKLLKLHEEKIPTSDQSQANQLLLNTKKVLKVEIPDVGDKYVGKTSATFEGGNSNKADKAEFERGLLYLRKFKTISKAFITGDFKPSNLVSFNDNVSGGQKYSLYNKLAECLPANRIYNGDINPTKEKGGLYHSIPSIHDSPAVESSGNNISDLKLYTAAKQVKKVESESEKVDLGKMKEIIIKNSF